MAGIYIHIPFCKQACHYCNFHFSTSLRLKEKIIESIIKEIQIKQDFFGKGEEIQTIYFGGGSPSILSTVELNKILSTLYKCYPIANDVEITLEANPDDISITYLKDLKSIGVNRFSLGIQAFDNSLLKYMNRAHTEQEARRSLDDIATIGFKDISIDLIYGIPELDNEKWLSFLETAISYPINHISCYALTVEPKTALHHFVEKKDWDAPDEETSSKQFLIGSDFLEDNGYTHYEISNFALHDNFSKHNTAYWRGIPYLGLGPSAHSFDGTSRYWNIANNSKYIKLIEAGQRFTEMEKISRTNSFNEYLMIHLRTMWGIDLEFISKIYGDSEVKHVQKVIQQLPKEQYLLDGNQFKLSKKGWLWCDSISQEMFVD